MSSRKAVSAGRPARRGRQATPRKKPAAAGKVRVPTITSWPAVDRFLGHMARIDAQADALCADVNRRVQAVKDKATARHIRLAAERAALEAEIEVFAKSHKTDFGKDRSIRLAHGRVGWRAAEQIRFTAKVEEIVAALEARGLDLAVMVTKRASKDVLATFDDALLADLGVKRRRVDKFYIDLDEAQLARP